MRRWNEQKTQEQITPNFMQFLKMTLMFNLYVYPQQQRYLSLRWSFFRCWSRHGSVSFSKCCPKCSSRKDNYSCQPWTKGLYKAWYEKYTSLHACYMYVFCPEARLFTKIKLFYSKIDKIEYYLEVLFRTATQHKSKDTNLQLPIHKCPLL